MTISKSFKYLTVIFLLLVSVYTGSAQILRISSPYTRYGLGELQTSHSVYSASMGGLSNALRNPGFINTNNPASYSSIDTNTFIFDVGINSTFTQLKTTLSTQGYINHTSLSHVLLGFPITRWCGVSAGIIPFSKTGYQVPAHDSIGPDIYVADTFTGNGGINQAYLGIAFEPFKNFSFGVNVGYLFGTINKVRAVYLPDIDYSYNIRIKNNIKVSDIYMNYGLQYQINLKKSHIMTVGAKFNLPIHVTARQDLLAERFTSSGSIVSVKDTLLNLDEERGTLYMPLIIGGGLTFAKKNIWMVGADFNWENWKKFKSFGKSDSIGNAYNISVGGEYTPQHNSLTSYLKRMSYRAGFHFSQSYFEVRNTKINDFSVSIGLGFPIKKTKTTLNVSMEAGSKGTTRKNLLQENYIRIILNISFRDFWFFRPKLD